MRYAVLADVHGNLAALQAVLGKLERDSIDSYLVAGDLVGYGPHPNECVEAVAGLGAVCVAGNHDLMALGQLSDERCIPLGRTAIRWTRGVLDPAARAYLERLPLRAETPDGVVVSHGSLDDPERYTTNAEQALSELAQLERERPESTILVLGHTHRPLAVGQRAGRQRVGGRHSSVRLGGAERYLVNAGAVGQSRELRARARYAVLDLTAGTVEFHAIAYDTAACRRALREAGLAPGSCHLRPSARGAARRVVRGVRRRTGALGRPAST
jgi:predicted phosphodiesterase